MIASLLKIYEMAYSQKIPSEGRPVVNTGIQYVGRINENTRAFVQSTTFPVYPR